MIRKLEYIVDESFHGKTVLSFLRAQGFSSRIIKDIKYNPHGILVRNKKVTVQKTLKKGDRLTVYIREKDEGTVVPREYPLDIVYEDRDVIVINKPPFMATHPSQDNYDNTLANALAFYFEKNNEKCIIRSVNRLDKNTSGIILVAKNALAAGILSDDLKDKRIERQYLAIVEGRIDADGTVDAPIGRCDGSTIKRCVCDDGDRAITHFEPIRSGDAFSLIKLTLETGRTHQIRVHMSHIGHPVAGDFLYGTEFSGGISRHALHSCNITFTHPITKEKLHFEVDIPKDMEKLYETIGI